MWRRGLKSGSAAARLLGLWIQLPLDAWMSVCCECCLLSGGGICVGLITRPTECGVTPCDSEASVMRMPCPNRVGKWPSGR